MVKPESEPVNAFPPVRELRYLQRVEVVRQGSLGMDRFLESAVTHELGPERTQEKQRAWQG